MKTTKRLDNAISKLYNAFHNGKLNAWDCSKCAVGNICDNQSNWQYVIIDHKNYQLENYKGLTKSTIDKTGYTYKELGMIEHLFIKAHSSLHNTKQHEFEGLCKVVEYLCELDNIPNVMDYTSLFDYGEKGAVNELEHII